MAELKVTEILQRTSVHSNSEVVSSATELGADAKRDVKLKLLGSKKVKKKRPKWMKHYEITSYIICTIIASYSFVYLGFIGVHQANPRMQIQYYSIVRFLEYNSYSIFSPLLCPIYMGLIVYHIKYRVKLDEGDFFGMLGILLFLMLVNVHDSWGILKLRRWRDYDLSNKPRIEPPPIDIASRNDLHWQYAWSTRTICARRFVRDIRYKYEYSRKHVVRQIVLQAPQHTGPGLSRNLVLKDTDVNDCNAYHDIKSRAKVRDWMMDIQNEFKCCGPYGFKLWREWFDSDKSTGCDLKELKMDVKTNVTNIPSCYDPLMRWFEGILVKTYWIMVIQAVLYFVSMIVAGLHYTVMKYEEEKLERVYSLLSLTDHFDDPEPHWWTLPRPASKAVIVGEWPIRPAVTASQEAARKQLKGAFNKVHLVNQLGNVIKSLHKHSKH